jgi:hypothetical protein
MYSLPVPHSLACLISRVILMQAIPHPTFAIAVACGLNPLAWWLPCISSQDFGCFFIILTARGLTLFLLSFLNPLLSFLNPLLSKPLYNPQKYIYIKNGIH